MKTRIVAAGIASALLVGCVAEAPEETNEPASAVPSNVAFLSPETDIAERIKPIRKFGEFTNRLGFRHAYYQVHEDLGELELIFLAQLVHSEDKEAWLWFFDDDAQAEQMLKALPEVEHNNAENFPQEWYDEHLVGRTYLELMPQGGRRHVLGRGKGETFFPLSVAEG